MATVARVTRVANPRRGRGKVRAKRHNPRHRRRLTAKQIKYFGTPAQKAGLKRRRKHSKHTVRSKMANPRRKRAVRRVTHVRRYRAKARVNPRRRRSPAVRATYHRRRRRATSNPALVVTLGPVNPKRRKTYMAKRKRAHNPRRRRYAARRHNASVRVVARHRRRRVNIRHRRRHNPLPSFFGATGTKGLGTTLAGGLLGVAAAKLLPGLVPANLIPITGVWPRVIITGVSAWAAGTAATKFVGRSFGDAVFFGGLMQTGSMVLNAVLPNFKVGGVPLALSGMGELVPGSFPVPQNPLRIQAPAPAQARVTMNGLARAYGNAF